MATALLIGCLLLKACFILQYEDGHMLAVQLAKYKLVFDEVDTSGNGTLGAGELQHFFQKQVLLLCTNSLC